MKASHPPIIRPKQHILDLQDLQGSWQVCWKFRNTTLFSAIYTRIDQVFVLWALMTLLMFAVAQLLPLSWTLQAVIWSALTAIGAIAMVYLTTFWAQVERLLWLVYLWAALILSGALLTDLGIFLNWGIILLNLCPLWLGISALGYLCTGISIQSRALIVMGLVHLVSIQSLHYCMAWQFLMTGMIISGSLLVLAQVEWDMRPPIEYAVLTEEQKAFNRKQHEQRQHC
ncbi:hypothetical protein H6G20_24790 [Desertifilum sp. FACHB-1129]|uniref:Uncharacterized protein n=1 Tax=Desertifilum tharense IPPAS B-1220 TaxID=1781255 RepID=A0A1E5QIE5_9CYAN|nr:MULTISPECIES: hypothetical protein [Desertifilum]MDA0211850.1 hypothetical protein [Cyanobacteria bacterium FC1]MBD2314890.1 hypothetical protein [Desertifilum sp. FACHB-1129]MBD2320409.1 hypothetical protein [Desertifilum sp. FACHB-866]MBD2330537.1 hypothetical protein [Desertifilum sp. FACHB-868]OEJ74347.1 hypothetical protein BH720_14035 [Desertifilum tharense IPPAS B-1220]